MGDSARNTTVIPIGTKNTLFVGAILSGQYVLEQLLGEGGMGRVFLASNREADGPDRFVAIKVLGDVFREHPQSLSVMRKEAANALKLTHRNIVRVHTFQRDGPHAYIVMEYIRGESLDHFIKRHKDGVALREAWPMIRDCAQALKYMHEKEVVHSDFKPGNVFLTEDGEIKVLDLGLARTIDGTVAMDGRTRFDTGAMASAQPLGLTPDYASCEMWEQGTKPDPRDDIYALGCVAYQLLTGRHPFENMPAPKARAQNLQPSRPNGIRRRQWHALQQSLSFDRSTRMRSVDLFLGEFDRERRRGNATPWIVVTMLLVVFGAALLWFVRPPSPDTRFIEGEIASHPVGSAKAPKTADVLGWKSDGQTGLDLAMSAFRNKDYDTGAYYLHDGPTSVRFSYNALLERSAESEDRRAGAAGLLELSRLYATPAADLSTEDPAQALLWACRGLQINPYQPELRKLYSDLDKTVEGKLVSEQCGSIDWKTIGKP